MTDQIVVFTLDELSYGLPLLNVVKVIHALEIRQLPDAPSVIAGIINVKGKIIPVADIRKRLGLNSRETDPDDRLIIAGTGKTEVAIPVDSVTGIRDLATQKLSGSVDMMPFAGHISGIAKADDGLILIYNLEEFLSADDEKALAKALKKKKNGS
jgi:purine-binding chemotaxis protein CheW